MIAFILQKIPRRPTIGTVVLQSETYDLSNSFISFSSTDSPDDTVIINPDADFTSATTYSNLLIKGFKDGDGNEMVIYRNEAYDFTTKDIIPPVIVSIKPSDDSNYIGISQNIILYFNEELDETAKGTVSFADPAMTFEHGTNCEMTITSNTVIIDPDDNFDTETIYSNITIEGFQDLAGNIMAVDSRSDYDFTTAKNATAYFTGNVIYTPLDTDGDGIYDVLKAEVGLYVDATGDYALVGCKLLEPGTTNTVANTKSPISGITVTETNHYPAEYLIPLLFSGEDIFRSGLDGPYDLQVIMLSPAVWATFTTDFFSHEEFGEIDIWLKGGTEEAIDEDGDLLYDYIDVTPEVVVRVEGNYRISVSLTNDEGSNIGYDSLVLHFTPDMVMPVVRLPGWKVRKEGRDGPYHVIISLSTVDSGSLIDQVVFDTAIAYDVTDFNPLFETDGQIEDSGFDSNDNGLFESLQVSFNIDFKIAGTYVLKGLLYVGVNVVYAQQDSIITEGPQSITFEFSGPRIYDRSIDGPYQLEIMIRDSNLTNLDNMTFPDETAAYGYTDFESGTPPPADITLTGVTSDYGVNLDSDDLYEELHVDVGLELLQEGTYHWSACLFTSSGVNLCFSNGSSYLPEGSASIDFNFSGTAISAEGEDGPYYVKALLMYCDPPGDANLVAIEIAVTQFYSADEFE